MGRCSGLKESAVYFVYIVMEGERGTLGTERERRNQNDRDSYNNKLSVPLNFKLGS